MYKCCFWHVFRETARTAAKSRTNLSTNSGKATKQLDRLAPNLAHMCKFIWEWIYAKQIGRAHGGGGLGGQKLKQLLFTSADSSGNGHRLNTSRPSIPQRAFRFFRGSLIQKSGKLSNGWTDWHHIWYTSADSSGMDIA